MIIQIILAFFGSIFPAILFNIDRKKILWAGLCGSIGWTVYLLIFNGTNSPIAASFAGAIAVGVYSESMARVFKTPAFGFLIPGIFPLVPGFTAYTTLRYIVESNFSEALNKGIQTIAVGGSIAFGIMLSTAIFKFISRLKKQLA
ncbi:MAG: threonine/serine exporter family protein [Ruminiclostridium sp.]